MRPSSVMAMRTKAFSLSRTFGGCSTSVRASTDVYLIIVDAVVRPTVEDAMTLQERMEE